MAGHPDPVRRFPEAGVLAGFPELLRRRRDPQAERRCEGGTGACAETTGREQTFDRENARSQAGGALPGDRRGLMKRTDVTYGQLDRVLRSLGFSCRLLKEDPPARVYEHKE